MINWLSFPLVRGAIVFILGIYCGIECAPQPRAVAALWMVFFAGFAIAGFYLKGMAFVRMSPWLGFLGLFCLFAAGLMRGKPQKADPIVSRATIYLARVLQYPQVRPGHSRTLLELNVVISEEDSYASDDLLLYYQKKDQAVTFQPGQIVLIRGTPQLFQGPGNPHEFDYAAFLSRRNIHWRHWADSASVLTKNLLPTGSLMITATRIQKKLLTKVEELLPHGVSSQIVGAMLLGTRDNVSDMLEQSFADSGTLHLMAVSGLHMGILYWVLLRLFGWAREHRWLKWIFFTGCILLLWAFAFITGLAPSTRRAASMFTVLMVAEGLGRQGASWNALALSAIVIIWIEPYQLYQVGFQLSYTAVIGIMYMQPRIQAFWNPSRKVLKYFWSLAAVSLAAQLAVMPLSIYYFHQFPVYFLISNLLMVPLAFLILTTGLLFLLALHIGILTSLWSWVLVQLTTLVSWLAAGIAGLPGSTLDDLWISTWELLLAYLVMLWVLIFLRSGKKWPLNLALCGWLVMGLNASIAYLNQELKHQLVVYRVPGHTALDFIQGHLYFSYLDRHLVERPDKVAYHLDGFRSEAGLKPVNHPLIPMHQDEHFIMWMFRGKLVLLVNGPLDPTVIPRMQAAVVVVANNSVNNLHGLSQQLSAQKLIIDSSYKPALARSLAKEARNLGWEVYNVDQEGAQILKF